MPLFFLILHIMNLSSHPLIRSSLQFIHLIVFPLLFHQPFVCPLFHYPPFIQYENLVGILDRG